MKKSLPFLLIAALCTTVLAQKPNQVKGQGQLAGAEVSFGTVYSLKNGFNFEILKARYVLDPFDAYTKLYPQQNEKILLVDIAIKNARPEDNWFSVSSMFNLVDTNQNVITSDPSVMLSSKGPGETSWTLKPGQGLGQPELKDPLQLAWIVPAGSKIDKIIITQGRLNTSEDVLRYVLVAPPADPATSKVKNFVAPLPEISRTAGDTWGAILPAESKGSLGVWLPSGAFSMKVSSIDEPSGAVYGGDPAEEGKKFVVMTVTAKNLSSEELSIFEIAHDGGQFELTDTDGENYKPYGFRKTKADEDPDRMFKKNDEYTFRVFFSLPKEAKIKHVSFGAGSNTRYGFDQG